MKIRANLKKIAKELDTNYVQIRLLLEMKKLDFLTVEKGLNGRNVYFLDLLKYNEYKLSYMQQKIEILEKENKLRELEKNKNKEII